MVAVTQRTLPIPGPTDLVRTHWTPEKLPGSAQLPDLALSPFCAPTAAPTGEYLIPH